MFTARASGTDGPRWPIASGRMCPELAATGGCTVTGGHAGATQTTSKSRLDVIGTSEDFLNTLEFHILFASSWSNDSAFLVLIPGVDSDCRL
eukprot:COSAG02_NODE_35495_length_467_cov_1.105978_1_plen_91_part_10